jgi:hypothetical protein
MFHAQFPVLYIQGKKGKWESRQAAKTPSKGTMFNAQFPMLNFQFSSEERRM